MHGLPFGALFSMDKVFSRGPPVGHAAQAKKGFTLGGVARRWVTRDPRNLNVAYLFVVFAFPLTLVSLFLGTKKPYSFTPGCVFFLAERLARPVDRRL